MTNLIEEKNAGQRPVARPLMNSIGSCASIAPESTPVLSEKERKKIADMKKDTKKRQFAAQQLASLRVEDSLQKEEFEKMTRQDGDFELNIELVI